MEIFAYNFMLRAFAAGLMIGVIAPLIGLFLVVRRYSMLADTLAHVSLAGVAVGIITKINPITTAIVVSVLTGIGIDKLKSNRRTPEESILALFLWGGLAVAVVLISLAKGFNVYLYSYLFGSITTVSTGDIYQILALGLVTCCLILIFYKELFFISFDDELAQIHGIRVKELNLLLLILAAITVSLSMRIVGVILVGALMVIPVITALKFNRNFTQTIFISIGISLLSVFSGLFISYYFDIVSGGSIVLVAICFFLLSLIWNRFFIAP